MTKCVHCRNGTRLSATVKATRRELERLPEYSLSTPTSPSVGRSWKRRVPAFGEPHEWWLGMAVPCDVPDMVGFEWAKLEVSDD